MTNNKDDYKLAVFVAGGNGTGKTTLIQQGIIPKLNTFGVHVDFINADIWQKEHFGYFDNNNPNHAREAQAWANAEREKYIQEQRSFITETVFSHASKNQLIQDTKNAGYEVHLHHVGLNSPHQAIERISTRVALGGHHVDDDKVVSRAERANPLIAEASLIADRTFVYDNSSSQNPHDKVLELKHGKVVTISPNLPNWVQQSYKPQIIEYQANALSNSLSSESLKNNYPNLTDEQISKIELFKNYLAKKHTTLETRILAFQILDRQIPDIASGKITLPDLPNNKDKDKDGR